MNLYFEVTSRDDSAFINLGNVKAHLKITNSSSDDLITLYFKSAVEQAEASVGYPLVPTTLKYHLDTKVADQIHVVASAHTLSAITYGDVDAPTTFDGGTIRKLQPCPTVDMEALDAAAEDIRITVQCGYATMDELPGTILQGILHLVGERWKKRQDPSSTYSTLSDKLFRLKEVVGF